MIQMLLSLGYRLSYRAAICVAVTMLSSCMFGDDVMSVTGEIVDTQGKPLDNCMLALEAVRHDAAAYPFEWEETESTIERTFIWPFDRGAVYRLAISCPGYTAVFRTEPFVARDAIRAFPEPVDVGTIVMTK